MYRLDPKGYKLNKTPVPLTSITGFAISRGEDQAVVIHMPENDMVLTLRGNACAAELVSLVAQTLGKP